MAPRDENHELSSVRKDVSVSKNRENSPPWGARAAAAPSNDNLIRTTRVRKLFGEAQLFAFSLSFMSTWVGMNTNIWFALYQGGPQVLAWGALLAYIGAIAQAASFAEMSSMLPIAGAQYHWTYDLAPRSVRRFATWLQGWFTWFGWVSLECGIANITAIMVQQMAMLNHPDYVPQNWHITMIMIAMLVFYGAINSTRHTFSLVPWLELLAAILYVCLFVVFIAVYLNLGTRHSASWVFFHHETSSGWTNYFISWNLGQLTNVWSYTGIDGSVHMSEETKKAKQAVPRATLYSICFNGALGYGMAIVLLTCMGPMEDVLASDFPVATILLRVTGSIRATTAMVSGLIAFSSCLGIGSISSLSRLTWAWARDGGLPLRFAYVHPEHRIPVRAVWFSILVVSLLSLLNIGSPAAFGAISALSSMALYTSYGIAILAMLCRRYASSHGGGRLELGAWNLGRYGVHVNCFALLYTVWMLFFLPFPQTRPVTPQNMNYAGPIWIAVLVFALGSWFSRARKSWGGPNRLVVDHVKAQD